MKISFRKNSPSEVKRRIFEIIDSMPEIEVRNLHIGLEKWRQSKKCKRKHSRKGTSIYALFESDGLSFREHIKNISTSGLFIETGIPISVTNINELSIQFFHPDQQNVVRASGKIVRIDPNGIAVKFDNPQPRIV